MQKSQTIKNKIFKCVAICLGLIIAFGCGYFSRYIFDTRNSNVASDVIKLIDKVGYVYDQTTGEERLLTEKEIADAITQSVLDDYAKYYTAEELVDLANQRAGNNSGIGISFIDSDLIIDKVIGGSPAQIQGVKSGDKIISANLLVGQEVYFSTYENFATFMKDIEVGQTINLTVERLGEKITFSLPKQKYIASYVTYQDSEAKIGYENKNGKLEMSITQEQATFLGEDKAIITFQSFNGGCVSQLKGILDKMKERGRTKLVLDLRNNGGGYVELLQDVCSMLINNQGNPSSLVAVAKGKKGTNPQYFYTTKNLYYSHISSLSVLANENTASASECLIGALIHYGELTFDRLVIEKNEDGVAKTYGKGIMQTTYTLTTGGALKLTTAKIYWPDGQTSIHSKGIIASGENATDSINALSRALYVLDLP